MKVASDKAFEPEKLTDSHHITVTVHSKYEFPQHSLIKWVMDCVPVSFPDVQQHACCKCRVLLQIRSIQVADMNAKMRRRPKWASCSFFRVHVVSVHQLVAKCVCLLFDPVQLACRGFLLPLKQLPADDSSESWLNVSCLGLHHLKVLCSNKGNCRVRWS